MEVPFIDGEGDPIIIDVVEPVRKTNRAPLWKMFYIMDHKCDKLPEGQMFHKFRVETSVENRRDFNKYGYFEVEVECPYCGTHVIYEFENTRKTRREKPVK